MRQTPVDKTSLTPFLLLCLIGFAAFFSSYLRIPVMPLFAATQRSLAMGMYNSCIYLGMMTGSTVLGLALNQIGYPLGFAIAGGVTLLTLLLFFVMQEKQQH